MSKELVEKKNDLITRAEETLEKAKTEKRELTDAEMAELAEIRDNVRRIMATLKLDDDFRELGGLKEKKEEEITMTDEQRMKEKEKSECRAFEAHLRGIVLETRDGDPVELTKAANGVVIPTSIANRIIKKVYDISPILERSTKYNIKGTLELPYYDITDGAITVAYKDEFAPLSSNIGAIKGITLTGYLAGALALISKSLINNTQFDIVGFVVDEMAYSIHRFIEGELIHGTENKVTGLSTLANGITAAAADAITADEVIRLQGKIKDVFQANAMWVMSPATRDALRLLKDEMGRYLLNDDISAPFGKVLLGKPVYVSDNMDDIGASKKVIFYGDFKGLATKFNEDINVEVLRERYADQHAIGVIGWLEFDAKVEDAQKLAVLTMHA